MSSPAIDGVEQASAKGFIAYRAGEIEEIADSDLPITVKRPTVKVVYIGGSRDRETTSGFGGAGWKQHLFPHDDELLVVSETRFGYAGAEHASLDQYEVLGLDNGVFRVLADTLEPADEQTSAGAEPSRAAAVPDLPRSAFSADPAGLNDRLSEWLRARIADLSAADRDRLEYAIERQADARWLVLQVLLPGLAEERAGDRINAVIGPWKSADQVGTIVDASSDELEDLVRQRKLLGIRFNDGQLYFPSRQFREGALLPGLEAILHALGASSGDTEAWAIWFAGDFRSSDGEVSLSSKWEALGGGYDEDLLWQAARDAKSWIS